MQRSNSFVNSLKWWPVQGQTNQVQAATEKVTKNVHSHQHQNKSTGFGSSVAVQKLRESKWFTREEERIFCAVVECGFIVEIRAAHDFKCNTAQQQIRLRNNSYEEDEGEEEEDELTDELTQDENEKPAVSWFGIILCKSKDNKPKVDTIEIYSVKIRANGTFKIIKIPLESIWNNGWQLRINNFADKEKQPHNEKDIRNQVSFARKAKQSLWNNDKHFVYWCRYGSRQQDVRKRQIFECVKWGSVGMNAGMLLVMSKQKL